MLTPRNQEIAKDVTGKRIALLTEIIRTGNEASATMAALRLTFIGTKESTDALMDLIRTTANEDLHRTLAPLVILSQFRDDHRDELNQLKTIGKEIVDLEYEDIAKIDQRVLEAPPLWQEITEALEADFAQQLREAKRELILI